MGWGVQEGRPATLRTWAEPPPGPAAGLRSWAGAQDMRVKLLLLGKKRSWS